MSDIKSGAVGILSEALSKDLSGDKGSVPKIRPKKDRPIVPDDHEQKSLNATIESNVIREINTSEIRPWHYADRPVNEFGDLEALTNSIKVIGQEIPALLRPASGGYELIYGRRRLEVCKDLGIKLKAIVRDVDDADAFSLMVVENNDREGLTAWARCQSYTKALNDGIYKSQYHLADKCNLSRSTIQSILVYNKLPDTIVSTLPMSRVGMSAAKVMLDLIRNDKEATEIFLNADNKFYSEDSIGPSKIKAIYRAGKMGEQDKTFSKVITNKEGSKLFKIGKDRKGFATIKLAQKINIGRLEKILKEFVDKENESKGQ